MRKIENKLIDELKLHDATISSMRLQDNDFCFIVDCKGMKINNIFNDLDNVFFTIKCSEVMKFNFDFDGMIIIDELNISKKDDIIIIDILNGDLYIECKKYNVELKEVYKNSRNKILDIIKKI